MGYFYAAMWLVAGLLLIFSVSKENKIFYFLGGYFVFMGIWWGINEYLPEINLFDGVYGWVFRGISAAVLIVIGIFYYKAVYLPRKNGEKEE